MAKKCRHQWDGKAARKHEGIGGFGDGGAAHPTCSRCGLSKPMADYLAAASKTSSVKPSR